MSERKERKARGPDGRVTRARTKDFCGSFLVAFRVSERRNLVEKGGERGSASLG